MGITYGDYLIDIGANDITPEQEREIEAREECTRRGIDPDDDAADGVAAWMVVDKESRERQTIRYQRCSCGTVPQGSCPECRDYANIVHCEECRTDKNELLFFSPYSQRYVHSSCRTIADDPS
jgi:hypothetical protein